MKVFLSGIAGTGMSSLAGLMNEKGFDVFGSDRNFYPPTGTILKEMKITLFNSFNEKNIPGDIDFCVVGNIISRGNPEAEYILNMNIPYLSMAEALYRYFIKGRNSVVVAGTHGKTTTSSFLAFMFNNAGLNPGFFIGGKPIDQNAGYSIGKGNYFISEGDEYETSFFDRSSKFLKYHPKYLLLTSLEYDHIDFFRTSEDYLYSFKNLVNQVPSKGIIIVNSDYSMGKEAVSNSLSKVITYGKDGGDYRIREIDIKEGDMNFKISHRGDVYKFRTTLPGQYNVWNLTAGIILGINLGIPMEVIKKSVMNFRGVERRLKQLGNIDNTLYFEDFAHHPTSISAVLLSLKEIYPEKRIEVYIEPGSWSLKHKMFEERLFHSLRNADRVVIKSFEHSGKFPESYGTDLNNIVSGLIRDGKDAKIAKDYEEIKSEISNSDNTKNRLVVILSNGGFGGIPNFVSSLIKNHH